MALLSPSYFHILFVSVDTGEGSIAVNWEGWGRRGDNEAGREGQQWGRARWHKGGSGAKDRLARAARADRMEGENADKAHWEKIQECIW